MERNPSTINKLRKELESIVNLLNEFVPGNETMQQASDDEPKQQQDYLGELPYRVVHLKNNPMEMKIKAKQKEFDQLREDNERLRARLEILESGSDGDVTRAIEDPVNQTDQIEILSRRVAELQLREDKILGSFKKMGREFREVCYLLIGYRVDALKDNTYRLSNMYAESEDDNLFFEISPDGTIQLLKNEYSDRLTEFIETYLENADSFPAFLASITLDLYKSSTQLSSVSVCMSTCMSTTIQPNPGYNPRRG